jgi:hypothetical protein
VKITENHTPRQYPTEAQRILLTSRRLAEECFEEVERRFAAGTTLDQAKRDVLEERVPAYIQDNGAEVGDLVINAVMSVTERGTSPGSRRAHRDRRLHLTKARATSGNPPSLLDRFRFFWFGRERR